MKNPRGKLAALLGAEIVDFWLGKTEPEQAAPSTVATFSNVVPIRATTRSSANLTGVAEIVMGEPPSARGGVVCVLGSAPPFDVVPVPPPTSPIGPLTVVARTGAMGTLTDARPLTEAEAFADWLAALPGHRIVDEAAARRHFVAVATRRLAVPGDAFVRDWRGSRWPVLAIAG